jgi:hypothetical protein
LAARAYAADASALSGEWHVKPPIDPNYVPSAAWPGTLPLDFGRAARYEGYIVTIDGTKIDIALADRTKVVHLNCKIESSEVLHCINLYRDGSFSPPFDLVRKGPGPKKLMPVIQ